MTQSKPDQMSEARALEDQMKSSIRTLACYLGLASDLTWQDHVRIAFDATDALTAALDENDRLRKALERMIQTVDAITDKAWCDSVSMDEVVAVEEEMFDARDALKGTDQ